MQNSAVHDERDPLRIAVDLGGRLTIEKQFALIKALIGCVTQEADSYGVDISAEADAATTALVSAEMLWDEHGPRNGIDDARDHALSFAQMGLRR